MHFTSLSLKEAFTSPDRQIQVQLGSGSPRNRGIWDVTSSERISLILVAGAIFLVIQQLQNDCLKQDNGPVWQSRWCKAVT